MRLGSYYLEPTALPVSNKFRERFYLAMSQRDVTLTEFVDIVNRYGGEFISGDVSFKIRYDDVVIIIEDGVLVNLFKLRAKKGVNKLP